MISTQYVSANLLKINLLLYELFEKEVIKFNSVIDLRFYE